jgi:hypothetical protein
MVGTRGGAPEIALHELGQSGVGTFPPRIAPQISEIRRGVTWRHQARCGVIYRISVDPPGEQGFTRRR